MFPISNGYLHLIKNIYIYTYGVKKISIRCPEKSYNVSFVWLKSDIYLVCKETTFCEHFLHDFLTKSKDDLYEYDS